MILQSWSIPHSLWPAASYWTLFYLFSLKWVFRDSSWKRKLLEAISLWCFISIMFDLLSMENWACWRTEWDGPKESSGACGLVPPCPSLYSLQCSTFKYKKCAPWVNYSKRKVKDIWVCQGEKWQILTFVLFNHWVGKVSQVKQTLLCTSHFYLPILSLAFALGNSDHSYQTNWLWSWGKAGFSH